MIVVDASVLANALIDDGPFGDIARANLTDDVHWAGPEHLRVEVFSAIRGRVLGTQLSASRATEALEALRSSAIETVPSSILLTRMWQLRNNISGYDAGYIAAAEVRQCPLITADARLAYATGPQCEIRVCQP